MQDLAASTPSRKNSLEQRGHPGSFQDLPTVAAGGYQRNAVSPLPQFFDRRNGGPVDLGAFGMPPPFKEAFFAVAETAGGLPVGPVGGIPTGQVEFPCLKKGASAFTTRFSIHVGQVVGLSNRTV